jgi:Cdc6-like AAA superfamily ATPase
MLLSLIHGTSKSKCNRRNLGPALMSWMSSSGLLTGLSDPNLAEFYTQRLLTKNAANMLKQHSPSAIGLAARRDGDGDLVQIHRKAIVWVNENKLWDRKQLMSALELVKQPGRGEFICLLGGKSTGKTLALQTFSESSRNIIKINGRLLEKKQGILMAVIEELTANSGLLQIHKFATNPIVLMETMKASCFALLGMPPETDLTEVVDKFRLSETQDRQDAHILKKLLGILSDFYGPLTLIMDEANLIFDHKQGTDHVLLAKDYLEVLTALSKQSRQVFKCNAAISWADAALNIVNLSLLLKPYSVLLL